MERLLEFTDIALIPAEKNNGVGKYNFGITDELDNSTSLPIFTSPMDSVVSERNWNVWSDNGIKPVLPRTTDKVAPKIIVNATYNIILITL